ncbi:MAG: hypothetical protein ACOX69_02435 [Coriobacteriales bacterium]|jgi:cobalamin biosynthesis Mg chelatase CobN
MGKVTHISDVENKLDELADEDEMREVQEQFERNQRARERLATQEQKKQQQVAQTAEPEAQAAQEQEEQELEAEEVAREAAAEEFFEKQQEELSEVTTEAVKEEYERTADEEAEFHGLTSEDHMSAGHVILIILAAIIVVAAILYVVNTYVHFI